jgi:hypothetical protein
MNGYVNYRNRLLYLGGAASLDWTLVRSLEFANLAMLIQVAFAFYPDITASGPNVFALPFIVFGVGFAVWRLLVITTVGGVGRASGSWLFRDGNLLWIDVLFSFLIMGGITRSVWPSLGGLAALVPAVYFRRVVRAHRHSHAGPLSGAR